MFNRLLRTSNDIGPLILRLFLGVVIFPHGAQKALGLFGGYGFTGTMGFFTQKMQLPVVLALLVIAAEFLGSIGLITGFLTRLSAFGIASNMIGAIFLVHLPNGFFMNWSGKQAGEGFEFHLLAIGIALVLLFTGGGGLSIDGLISQRSN